MTSGFSNQLIPGAELVLLVMVSFAALSCACVKIMKKYHKGDHGEFVLMSGWSSGIIAISLLAQIFAWIMLWMEMGDGAFLNVLNADNYGNGWYVKK